MPNSRSPQDRFDSMGEVEHEQLEDSDSLPEQMQPRNALLIESNDFTSRAIITLLGAIGIDVNAVNDAETGINMIDNNDFDCVIVNSLLRDTCGYDVAKRIRKLSHQLPIAVIISAKQCEQKTAELYPDIDAVIQQPIRVRELYSAVGKLMSRAFSECL